MLKITVSVLLVLSSFASGFMTGRYCYPVTSDPVVRREYVRDTIKCVTVEPAETIVRREFISVASSGRDTVYLPVETRVYRDTLYYAEVSGYRPSLDSLVIFPQRIVETRSFTSRSGGLSRWGIGVTAGVALTPRGIEPGVTVGVTYNLARF